MKKFYFLLALIFFWGVFLRLYQLGQVPPELNRDELSLAYNAYSILETGKEEHGLFLPINIESFGDWKLPVYVYALIPFIKILGLTAVATKLPSMLAGSFIILLAALIVLKLTKNKNLSLLTAALISISPWSIHLSHMAYEAHVAMFLFLSGFLSLLVAFENKKKNYFYLLTSLLWGLTLFTYHSYQVFMPLMAVGTLYFYRKNFTELFKKDKKLFIVNFLLAAVFVVTLVFTSYSANQTKFSGLSILDKTSYKIDVFEKRGFFENRNSLAAKFYSSSFTSVIDQFQRNIGDLYSAKFLFFDGGNHGSHDIKSTGKFYPIAAPFMLIAIFYLIKEKKEWQKLILYWLLAASIAPLITFEAAHSIRFSPALFGLELLTAFGILKFLSFFKNKYLKKISLILICLIFAYSIYFFLTTYFVVSPKRDIDHHEWQMKTLISLIQEKQTHYDKVIFPGAQWSPYIYFLYYKKYDPALLSGSLEYYSVDNEGFHHVRRLDNIYFEDPNWKQREGLKEKILYVLKEKEIPEDKFELPQYHIEYILDHDYSKHRWILLSYEE